ncbi:DNA replication complex GINS protein PSF2-like protein [Tanacetum coccineum]
MSGQSDPRASTFSAAEGEFGPFHPAMPTQVPIWLAVALKKRGKCQIRPPDWMSVVDRFGNVNAIRSFSSLSLRFFGALKFEQPQRKLKVRSLIEDIKDVRFHKIGTGLEKLSSLY